MHALARILAAVLLALAFAPAWAQPVKIRAAYVVPVANWAPILFEKEGLAKHQGKSYTYEAVRFQGTPPMITALANNELEIADLAFASFAIAVENAGMKDLRVIADEFQDGVPGYYTDEFFVLKDGPVKSVKDLKGKVLATNAAGSAVDIIMRAMLRKNGIDDKKDVNVVEAAFPNMKSMLLEQEGRRHPGRDPVLLRQGAARELARAVHAEGGRGPHADDHLGGARGLHQEEPRGDGRLHGGRDPRRALVARPEEPQGGRARSRRASASVRRRPSRAGSSRRTASRATTTAIATCCPT